MIVNSLLKCLIYVAEEAAHTAEFIEKMFLLGILDWLSKIKSQGNDGRILIVLYVVSVIVCIIDCYMYQVDLNKLHILTF